MSAPVGNEYWKLGPQNGRPRIYETADQLLNDVQEYIDWAIATPLKESKVFAPSAYSKEGEATIIEVDKLRPLTIEGLTSFLKIGASTWKSYKKVKELLPVVELVMDVMHAYNVDGAAADLLNSNIVVRKLGLKEHQDHSSDDGSMTPITSITRTVVDP